MNKMKMPVVRSLLVLALLVGYAGSGVRAQSDHIDAFRDVGMGRGLTLLHSAYTTDSLTRLVKGASVVALYDDYAITDDRYTISNKNGTETAISCGLPGSGFYKTGLIDSVMFSSYTYLSATLNGNPIIFKREKVADSLIVNDGCKGIKNWYVTSIKLPPGISEIDIRSLVNTHDAVMLNGDNIEHSHGFGFLLSSLSSWNSDAVFRLLIISKLTAGAPMQGIYPLHGFMTTGSRYVYDFRLTGEAVPHNVVMRYGQISMYTPKDKSNIRSISSEGEQLATEITGINPWSISMGNYHPVYLDNFRPFPTASLSIGGIILAFALLFGTVIFLIIRSGKAQIRQMRRDSGAE